MVQRRSSSQVSRFHESESVTEVSDTDAEAQTLLGYGQTPLPKAQFAVLCLLRMLDPLNYSQIFPYINELVQNLGVARNPTQIGYYSGLVESVFAIAQLIAMYPWGVLSDTVGRRPVILAGAAGLTITTLIFGLARDFESILISRILAGLFSGNVAVIPSVLCEITDLSNQAFAFPLFGIFWPIGAIIGPMIGGSLSKPMKKFPISFNYPFFIKYPYFLPCCVTASFSAVGFISCYFFLEETLGKKQGSEASRGRAQKAGSYGATDDCKARTPELAVERKKYSVGELLNVPIIRAICASACALSFISTAFEVVFVLFCYSPVRNGGLGFSPEKIGYALAISGVGAALLQALIMPRILVCFNHARLYHFGMQLWPIPFLLMPLLNAAARMGLNSGKGELDQSTMVILWVGIAALLTLVRVSSMGFSINMLLVKTFAPSPAALGATYGLMQFSICLARSVSPAFSSSLYVMSHQNTMLDGNSWVFVFVLFSGIGCLTSSRIVHHACRD